MRRVRLIADARLEFFKEIEYYERERQGLGRRFRRAAEAAFLQAGACRDPDSVHARTTARGAKFASPIGRWISAAPTASTMSAYHIQS